MDNQILQIAQRLKGLRDALFLSPDEVAVICELPVEQYLQIEDGQTDIPIGALHRISQHYNVELSAILFGDEPRMTRYFLTRKGAGATVERSSFYKYQSLAAGFSNRKADPFIVTVDPNDYPTHLNTHSGQEFNLVLNGSLLLEIGGKQLTLENGDSIYFDASLPHGMKALNNQPVTFLAVIL